MTKCKKLLVTLVSVVCIVVCALGQVACGGGNDPNATTYTVTVTDTTAAKTPVANVTVELWSNETKISTEDGSNYTESNQIATAKTNASGKAQFVCTTKTEGLAANEFNAVEGATYYAKSGEAPKGYKLHTEKDSNGWDITNFYFDDDNNTTITFDYLPNNFYTADRARHPYVREFKVVDGQETIDAEGQTKTLELQVKPGVFSYFEFAPYKTSTVGKNDIDPYTGEPIRTSGMTDADADQKAREITNKIVQGAQKAASGVYELSITATPSSANPVLKQFYNMYNGFDKTTGEPTQFAPDNTVTLKTDTASSTSHFYVTAEAECTVTVTVTRTADVEEETKPGEQVEKVTAKEANEKPISAKELTAVPEDSTIVKGNDGYYHLGSETGPVVLVMLKESPLTDERVGSAINDWITTDGNGNVIGNGYICTDSKTDKKYDYETFVKAYNLNATNADGVCYLTDEMKSFLELAAANLRFAGCDVNNAENGWILPCVYYAQDNPAITLNEKFDMVYEENDVIFTFTTGEEGGWYTFEGGEMSLPVPAEIDAIELTPNSWNFVYNSYEEENKAFYLDANTEYVFNVMFNDEARHGDTYSITLIEGEAPLVLTVGEDQEVTLSGSNATALMEFDGQPDGYIITVNPGRGLNGQDIILYVEPGMGRPQQLTLNASNNYSVQLTIYNGYKFAFSCEGNLLDATIWVTIASAT